MAAGSQAWQQLLARRRHREEEVEERVREVLQAVAAEGDAAVLAYTRRWDGVALQAGELRVGEKEIAAAYRAVEAGFLSALRHSRDHILAFHRRSVPHSWIHPEAGGRVTGQLYRPLARVGTYIPGGTAAYPSSVLMTALPARVAGVEEIVMVTPPRPDGSLNPYTLVAAAEAGVTEIYRVGGAQAVAALAYGTSSIRRVDKIVGPGNIYVATAKRLVYGLVDIDMVAGPSEVVIVADGTADPAWLAADLLSQAEHDPRAQALLLVTNQELAALVDMELAGQLRDLSRREMAARALEDNGAIVITDSTTAAIELANELAPEHLELVVADPWAYLGWVRNAGAVFLGPYTPEPVGDYLAGPSHVLPTGGTARFFSPLGVEDFMKRTSLIAYTRESLAAGAASIITLARLEGLDAHARAVEIRQEKEEFSP